MFRAASNKGFTLIELLVVISIIGMLSSVIMVTLQGARKKATVAAGTKFDTHTYRAFGADAMGIYDFETGATTVDSSGNNRNLTLSSSAGNPIPVGVDGYSGKALMFNGFNWADSPSAPASSRYVLGSNWTMTGWAYPASATPGGSGVVSIAGFPYIGWQSGRFYFAVRFAGCTTSSWFYGSTQGRSLNEWYHIALTRNSTGATLYVNGKEDATTASALCPDTAANILRIGSYGSGTYGFIGRVDSVRIYNQSITAAEAAQQYALEAAARGIATK